MVWVDRIIGEIEERFAAKIKAKQPLVIRDEKTLSGRVHVGSLRGIAIHGMIAQVLNERGIPNVFRFEFNDVDPMDEIPRTLDRATYEQYMGQPLYTVPAPEGSKSNNYPMIFGDELAGVIDHLGFPLEYYTLKPEYESGKFNETIRLALDHAKEIRAIYKEVSGSVKPDDWHPLQVICEKCGKVGTTQVTSWNGKTVDYVCRETMVTWAKGCGHTGTIDPFDGRAKLPWKVEWPAKWKVFGVDIEGAGKDHSAAGGSRDIGRRICEEIFHYPEPFNIPYEFFNLGGKKMSASKGIGASAKEIADLLPATLLRLLMIRKLPNQPIDFDPEGTTIPTLFDEYDRLAEHYFGTHKEPDADFARSYHLAHVDFPGKPKDQWHMRFTLAAFLAQMPHLDAFDEAKKMKGSALNAEEKEELSQRLLYTKRWLDAQAPAKYKFTVRKGVVPPDLHLSDIQKEAFTQLKTKLESGPWTGETIHAAIHGVKEATGIAPLEIFQPLYIAFLDRTDGPQMGWFLSTLEKPDVLSTISMLLEQKALPAHSQEALPQAPSEMLLQHADYGHLLEGAHSLIGQHADQTKAHLLATGAAMEALAKKFGGDAKTWKVAGMLHDLDWDHLDKDYEKHCGQPLEDILKTIKAPQELLADIRAHYASKYGAEYPLDTMLRKALYCVDELTGFIIAVTLVRPSKKLFDVEVSSIKKKLKDKGFAAQVDREQIKQCETLLSLPLDEFIGITLEAMKSVASELGL